MPTAVRWGEKVRHRKATRWACRIQIRALGADSVRQLAALVLLATSPHVLGQAVDPLRVGEEGLRRQEERGREQQRSIAPRADELVPAIKAHRPGELPEESPCFPIQEIRLVGPDSGEFAWLTGAATPYLRKCIGAQGLGVIARELDEKLRRAGHVTSRVALPPQNLQSGELHILVQAGRVARVEMVEGSQSSVKDERWGTWRNAFPMRPGDVLDIRDLEQGVENMKRLPSQQVTTRLEPGEEPGSSVVVVERPPAAWSDRVRGAASLDNSGGAALGRAQLGLNASLDNPLGLNDVLTLGLNTNAQRPSSTHRSQSGSVGYSIPWGYTLLSVNSSSNRFAQYVQGTTVRFLSSGRSAQAEARLQHVLWRTSSSKMTLQGAVSTRRAVSYLDDVEVVVQRRRTTNAELGIGLKHLFSSSMVELDVAHRRGVGWGGAQDDFATAAAGGLTLRPRVWTFDVGYTTEWRVADVPVQYGARIRGQLTRDTTLSVDQFSIGSRSSVRGFNGDTVLIAENGMLVRNEWTTPLRLPGPVQISGLLALDLGRVWGPSDLVLAGNKLAGGAVGLRGRWASTYFDLTLGVPLLQPANFPARRATVYLSLTQTF